MTLPRDEIEKGFTAEMSRFAALVRSLDPAQLGQPSRCEGWTTGDVAAHVIGTMADVVGGRLEGLGSPEVTERQVVERRGRSGAELADELDSAMVTAQALLAAFDDEGWRAPAPEGVASSVGSGIEALWYDAYLHADDIRAALGRPSEREIESLRASVSHIAEILGDQGWGPATLALDGIEAFPVGGGGGPQVTGDPLEFVLAATGRADPAELGLDPSVNIYR